ncbi:hypothetical protein MMC30_009291 [Trapelia coarctata]|nr:hypothetical protein [Trapelia coarctata]
MLWIHQESPARVVLQSSNRICDDMNATVAPVQGIFHLYVLPYLADGSKQSRIARKRVQDFQTVVDHEDLPMLSAPVPKWENKLLRVFREVEIEVPILSLRPGHLGP